VNREYLRALETQINWLRWDASDDANAQWAKAPLVGFKSVRDDGTADDMSLARTAYRKPLLFGECYYLSPHIGNNLAKMAAEGVPDFGLDHAWVPTEYGFVVLGEPLSVHMPSVMPNRPTELLTSGVNSEGYRYRLEPPTTMYIDAFGWSPTNDGIQLACYGQKVDIDVDGNLLERLAKEAKAEGRQDEFLSIPESVVMRKRPGRGYYPMAHTNLRWGHTARAEAQFYRDLAQKVGPPASNEDVDVEVDFLYTFLMFVSDKRVALRQHRADRATRRRNIEGPRPDLEHVQVIVLRAEEDRERIGRETGQEPEHREFNWRWPVREHLRRNFRTGLKTIRVREYVKGPPDKPLKKADRRRLFAVVR
jgi:hypothetical protein